MTEQAVRDRVAAAEGDFTLESALCTYKSWHRPNRRYVNVYSDMLHGRIDEAVILDREVAVPSPHRGETAVAAQRRPAPC